MHRSESDAWILKNIPNLKASRAREILQIGEAKKLTWSPEVLTALLDKAGEDGEEHLPEPRLLKIPGIAETIKAPDKPAEPEFSPEDSIDPDSIPF